MKEIIKKIPLLILICFSFFYTDRVINIIHKNSKLMKELEKNQESYTIESVSAYIDEDTIIPGIKGKKINIDKSFNNMKTYNTFREELLIYDNIMPTNLLEDNKDKYIIKGSNKKEVSILLIVDSNNINKIKNIKNIAVFISHNILTIDNINKLKNNEIYTYGNNGIYTNNILINDNTLINNLSNNTSKYCLTKEKNDNVLNTCLKNNMYTIIPNIIGNYNEIKNNLSLGSIILLDSIKNLDNNIKYIQSKGYTITSLSSLLEE